MRFLFKKSLLAQEAEKIADLVNYEAQKQKFKIKQFAISATPVITSQHSIDNLLTKNKQKECHSF